MNVTQELIAEDSFVVWKQKVNDALKWQWKIVPDTMVMTGTYFAVVVEGTTEEEND